MSPERQPKSPPNSGQNYRFSDQLRWLSLAGLALVVIACGLPTLDIGEDGTYPGWPLLLCGWSGILGFVHPISSAWGWWANPFLLAGTIAVLLRRSKSAVGILTVALGCSLFSLLIREVIRNEAGAMYQIKGVLVGFWVWQAAIWFNLLVAAVVAFFGSKTTDPEPEVVEV